MSVPRVMHFVFGLKVQTEPFSLMHYLCLRSGLEVNRPDTVHFHFQHEPFGPLWDAIKPSLTLRPITDSMPLEGYAYPENSASSPYFYAHRSDFLRVAILEREGGVYADMDTLFIAPIPDSLYTHPFVMGHEAVDRLVPASALGGSLCNAFMMSTPGSRFARMWQEQMFAAFDGSWSRHSTFLPYQLSLAHPETIHVEPESSFFYLDWTASGIKRLFLGSETLPSNVYSLHLWAHLWCDRARTDITRFHQDRLTPAYVAYAGTTYSRYARPFLPPGAKIESALCWRIADAFEEATLRARTLTPRAALDAPAQPPGMTTRPSALFLSPVMPDPRGSGLQQRGFHLLRILAETARITLAIAPDPHAPVPQIPVPQVSGIEQLIDRCILLPDARSELSSQSFDRIFVFRLRMHEVAEALAVTAPHRSLDLDDLESATHCSIALLALRRGRLRFVVKSLLDALRYRLKERSILPRYDLVTVAKRQDAACLGLTRMQVAPNRIFVPALHPHRLSEPFTLLFVGTLGYYPNIDACLWIAESIVPALRRALPVPFRVRIAGRGADERLRHALAIVPEIDFLGEVSAIEPLYREAHAFLAAVRGGGGTKIKILEAFAHGCPVIATPHAHEGLPGTPSESILLANTPSQFAAHALTLYSNPSSAATLAASAHVQLSASTANAGVSSSRLPASSL